MTETDIVDTFDDFARSWPAQRHACRRLWEHIGARDEAALLEVTRPVERDICGLLKEPTDRSQYSVLAAIVRETAPDGAYLLDRGAATREVFEVAKTLERARSRHQQASFCAIGDSTKSLSRVVERLEQRLADRHPMETSFRQEWVPKAAVPRIVVRDGARSETETRSGSQTVQRSLGGQR